MRMSAETSKPIPNDRGQHLLRVLIQRYIQDGQPVGSRTLSKDAGLGPQPRNDSQCHVRSGGDGAGFGTAYLGGAHSNAKGLPTVCRHAGSLPSARRRRNSPYPGQISGESDNPAGLVGAVSSMLSEFTSMAGVVTVPRAPQVTCGKSSFCRCPRIVCWSFSWSTTEKCRIGFCIPNGTFTASELQQAQNFMNRALRRSGIDHVRSKLLEDLDEPAIR